MKPCPDLSIGGRNSIILVHVVLYDHLCSGCITLIGVVERLDSMFSCSFRLKICNLPVCLQNPITQDFISVWKVDRTSLISSKDFHKYYQFTKNWFYRILEAQIRNDDIFIFLGLCSKKNTRLSGSQVLKDLCIFNLISRM